MEAHPKRYKGMDIGKKRMIVMKTVEKDIMCTFVIPLYIEEKNIELLGFFKQAMESIFEQTCPEWSIIFVDDNSKNRLLEEYINNIITKQKQTIIYRKNDSNLGPGISRNIGIDIAYNLGSDVIIFQDQDDLSHPRRVEVTRETFKTEGTDLLYSYFIPIDEHGNKIEPEDLAYSMKTILENYSTPLVGKDVWKTLFAGRMYANLPSATSVRIEFAKKIPFPDRRSSEETYTWLVYSAHGAVFDFTREIPSKYRIPRNVKGSASRDSIGEEKWHQDMAESFIEAFFECAKCALERGTATREELKKLESLLYINLVTIFKREGIHDLAMKIYRDYIKHPIKI